MKIFTGKQIHEWDTYTMEHEPIRPIDLMERAAKALTDAIRTVGTRLILLSFLPDRETTEAMHLLWHVCLLNTDTELRHIISTHLTSFPMNASVICAGFMRQSM